MAEVAAAARWCDDQWWVLTLSGRGEWPISPCTSRDPSVSNGHGAFYWRCALHYGLDAAIGVAMVAGPVFFKSTGRPRIDPSPQTPDAFAADLM